MGRKVSEAEFQRLWLDTSISTVEIGRRLGTTRQAVQYRAKARGLPPRGPGHHLTRAIPPEREDEFRALWEARVSVAEICRRMGCRPWNVGAHAERLGYPPRVKGWRPYPADPETVRTLYAAGLSWGDIATGATRPAVRGLALRLGLQRPAGWRPTLTLAEWREQQFAARLAEVAAHETQIERDRRMGIRRAA